MFGAIESIEFQEQGPKNPLTAKVTFETPQEAKLAKKAKVEDFLGRVEGAKRHGLDSMKQQFLSNPQDGSLSTKIKQV